MKTTSDCIGIREYLLLRGLQPHHETAIHGMFLSPLREERTPSFSVRYDKGLWYDFGLGEGGTLLQLVMRLEGCGMAEAIRSLRKGSADEVSFQPLPTASPREDSSLRILGVGRGWKGTSSADPLRRLRMASAMLHPSRRMTS